jgi:8-hydroxy-5-deazaflavin:NADPH oxidoreductase
LIDVVLLPRFAAVQVGAAKNVKGLREPGRHDGRIRRTLPDRRVRRHNGLGRPQSRGSNAVRIAIVGTGSLGQALGKRWAALGHRVCFGTRNPAEARVQQLVSEAGHATSAATVADAAESAEVVVLAVPYDALEQTFRNAGDLGGKILIDCTNPVAMGADLLRQGLLIGHDASAGEEVARLAPGARVVKSLNTVGAPVVAAPQSGDDRAVMFYCGDDESAKQTTARLLDELGFDPVDCGPLNSARLLEPVAMLWISLAFSGRGPNFAFKMMKVGT